MARGPAVVFGPKARAAGGEAALPYRPPGPSGKGNRMARLSVLFQYIISVIQLLARAVLGAPLSPPGPNEESAADAPSA